MNINPIPTRQDMVEQDLKLCCTYLDNRSLASVRGVSRRIKDISNAEFNRRLNKVLQEVMTKGWNAPALYYRIDTINAHKLNAIFKDLLLFCLSQQQIDKVLKEVNATPEEFGQALCYALNTLVNNNAYRDYLTNPNLLTKLFERNIELPPLVRKLVVNELARANYYYPGPHLHASPAPYRRYQELLWEAYLSRNPQAQILCRGEPDFDSDNDCEAKDGLKEEDAKLLAPIAGRIPELQRITVFGAISEPAFEVLKQSGKQIDATQTTRPVSLKRKVVCNLVGAILVLAGYVALAAALVGLYSVMGVWLGVALTYTFPVLIAPCLLFRLSHTIWNAVEKKYFSQHRYYDPMDPLQRENFLQLRQRIDIDF